MLEVIEYSELKERLDKLEEIGRIDERSKNAVLNEIKEMKFDSIEILDNLERIR